MTHDQQHPDSRPPDVIEGEVTAECPHPRSPLDPDADGIWPTALRPVPVTERLGGDR